MVDENNTERRCQFVVHDGQCVKKEGHTYDEEDTDHVIGPPSTATLEGNAPPMWNRDFPAYSGGKGLRITDLLALSVVPRWGIVDMVRRQSVGDHTFRVLVIFTELARRLGYAISLDDILMVLHHDADESRTSDIPASAKDYLGIGNPVKYCPWLADGWPSGFSSEKASTMAYLADQIEAFTFLDKYGLGDHSGRVIVHFSQKLTSITPPEMGEEVQKLITEILGDSGR